MSCSISFAKGPAGTGFTRPRTRSFVPKPSAKPFTLSADAKPFVPKSLQVAVAAQPTLPISYMLINDILVPGTLYYIPPVTHSPSPSNKQQRIQDALNHCRAQVAQAHLIAH